jgi:hypothetical protein
MFKEIHIYDMDGTVVCSMHRFKTTIEGKIDLAYWIENCTPEKIANDSLLPLAKQYQEQLANPEIYVVIATARVMEQADFDFVKNVLGQPNKIISRNGRDDMRKGATMKIAGLRFLNNLLPFKNLKKFFYEDNKDYLYPVAEYLNAVPVYIPSNQGV